MINDLTEPTSVVIRFANVPSIQGRPFLGEWFTADKDKLELFDDCTYVKDNPFPLAEEGYPEGLVEGFHLLALLDHLSNPLLRVTDAGIYGLNYGLDRVRFTSIVRAGERLRLRGRVAEVKPRGEGFLVLMTVEIEVEGRERPGLVADWWVYFLLAATATSESDTVSNEASQVPEA